VIAGVEVARPQPVRKAQPPAVLVGVEERAKQLVQKSAGKLSKLDAMTEALVSDPDLAARWRCEFMSW
jgi:hypothetical protein